jgi:hypothetical protein
MVSILIVDVSTIVSYVSVRYSVCLPRMHASCQTTDSESKSSSEKFKINLFPDDPFDDAQAKYSSDGSTIKVCICIHMHVV